MSLSLKFNLDVGHPSGCPTSLHGYKTCATIFPMDKDNKLYEVAYLITPAFTEEEALDFHQKIKNEALRLSGLMDHEGDIKKRRLSYPINKMTEAYLAYFRVILPKSNAEALKKVFAQDSVLRSLFVETRRNPVRAPHIRSTVKASTTDETAPTTVDMAAPEPIDQAKIEEIDKKLEEILGK